MFKPNKMTVANVDNYLLIKNLFSAGILALSVMTLTACGNKEGKGGQALVRVNGEEITMLQVNDELNRAGVSAEQQEVATKQLLESLIDRQLLLAEAKRNKVDRSPETIQAIERSKVQIITQAYLKNILTKITKPTTAEVNEYFKTHPDYFSQRKQYDFQQVIIHAKDFSDELKAVIDAAQSIEAVVSWLDKHNVRYSRGKMMRHSTDLPEQMVAKLKELKKGQLFIVNEGEKRLLSSITDIKSSPVSAKDAEQLITQYLINKRAKDAADAEIAHLRTSAKIKYLGASAPVAP